MRLGEWSRVNADYGRKLFNSGLEGARSGREAFLHGGSFAPSLGESARSALKPAAFGVCLGVLSSCPKNGHKSVGRAIARGIVGGVVGFGLGLAWLNRNLAVSVVSATFEGVDKVRDEHWLERHPIDYA